MLQEASVDLTSMAMGGNSARHQGDENLLVKFYRGPFQNELKSREAGRPIFEEVDFIHIMIPGNKDSIIDRPMRESDKERFPEHYRKYKAREDQSELEGTLIEQWPGVTASQANELRYVNIRTVEQLANVADSHLGNIMGGPVLKQKAQKYLEVSKDEAAAERLLILEQTNQALEERLAEMAAEMDMMKKIMSEDKPKRGRPKKEATEE